MTKTLTEQWKDGKLKFGKSYWCSDDEGNIAKLVSICEDRFFDWILGSDVTKDVKQVLAPVPSYDEYNELVTKFHQLQKRLEIATKALKEYAEIETDDWIESKEVARKALKEMEGVE